MVEAGERALLADTVLFDFVLKGAKADAQELGGLLSVVGDLRESAPDGFPLDLLQGCSQGDDHGARIFPACLDLFREMFRLKEGVFHRDHHSLDKVPQLANVAGPRVEPQQPHGFP